MKDQRQEMVLSIPSDFKYLGAVDAAVQDLAREFSFSDGAINDVSTAVIEACSNAVEHGNKFARDKRVKVVLTVDAGEFVGRVCDQGGGFDFDALMARDAPPDPMSERGRGLIIMKAFTDELHFSYDESEGLCVILRKANEEPAEGGVGAGA